MDFLPRKVCSHCKESKPELCFASNKGNKDGLSHWCRSCFSEYQFHRRAQKRAGIHSRISWDFEANPHVPEGK